VFTGVGVMWSCVVSCTRPDVDPVGSKPVASLILINKLINLCLTDTVIF
jgi:hypothetical protein